VPPTDLWTENPYGAAQKFLERNELPSTYVDQIVQFIEKNTAGVNLGSGSNNEFVDPFTGKSWFSIAIKKCS
jgi:phospholipase A-2-activating protein